MVTVREKTAIVTGGAKGIGFETCRQLLRNGAKTVAIFDLPNSNGEASVSTLNEKFGAGRALFFPSDVTKFDELEVVFKNAVKALGGLDILVNNAGILDDTTWQKEIEINFTAVVKSTLLGYDYMGTHRGGKGGIIVNMSSVSGLSPYAHMPVYSATKHAVVGFTLSLKDCFESTGVSVRVICPGVTDTTMVTNPAVVTLGIIDYEAAIKIVRQVPRQPCEYVGKAIITAIEKGANASVWVTQACEPPFEVELHKYEKVKITGQYQPIVDELVEKC